MLKILKQKVNDDTFSIYALILSANRKDADKFLGLDSFKTLCSQLHTNVPTNEDELHDLQYSIINSIILHKSRTLLHTLNQTFEFLHDEKKS